MPKPRNIEVVTLNPLPTNGGELSILTLDTSLTTVSPVTLMMWLKGAVPAYLHSRTRLTKEAIAIGVALIIVRDHSPRGSLKGVMASISLGRSVRTLERCIALAQKFLKHAGLINEKNHKITDTPELGGFLQTEFDFENCADPLLKQISDFAGNHTMGELLEADVIGRTDAETLPPVNTGKVKRVKLTEEQQARADFELAFKALKMDFLAGKWKQLFNPELIKLETWLDKARSEVSAENKARAAAQKKGGS